MGDIRRAPLDQKPGATEGIATTFAQFMDNLTLGSIPADLRGWAKLLIIDVIGVALIGARRDFGAVILDSVRGTSGPMMASVIGSRERLEVRNAALVNGVLMHGLDFDDSFMPGIVHPTVISLPAALAVGEAFGRTSADVLTAYIGGIEIASRLGLALGGLAGSGFHNTSVVGHFVSALVAGKLAGLEVSDLVSAQGLAASTAGGMKVYLEEGAWSKRFHAGWASHGGVTAALMAKAGYIGPTRPYEGRLGLFETFLGARAPDVAAATESLGNDWKAREIAIKPYPVCHYIHGCAEAAIRHHKEIGTASENIDSVTALVPPPSMGVVCEPVSEKINAAREYEVKFSLQHVVARALLSGRFGLSELEQKAIADPAVRSLAARIDCRPDPDTLFPQFCSGGVIVRDSAGDEHVHHVAVNLGAGNRRMAERDIEAKFLPSASASRGEKGAGALLFLLKDWENKSLAAIVRALRGN